MRDNVTGLISPASALANNFVTRMPMRDVFAVVNRVQVTKNRKQQK